MGLQMDPVGNIYSALLLDTLLDIDEKLAELVKLQRESRQEEPRTTEGG